jgi:hypothetical protein
VKGKVVPETGTGGPDPQAMVRRRLRRFLVGLPAAQRRIFRLYSGPTQRIGRGAERERFTVTPFWLLLPFWLSESLQTHKQRIQKHLSDIAWGQYCLFLVFRILDDERDAHTRTKGLETLRAVFYREALESFHRVGASTPRFSRLCVRACGTTRKAIEDVDRMQRTPLMGARLLEGYARQGEVFTVGSIALCSVCGNWRFLPQLRRFVRELAVAGQIRDDAVDLPNDTLAGRWTYAADLLYPIIASERDAKNMNPAKLASLVLRLRKKEMAHVSRARLVAHELKMKRAERWCARYVQA